MNSEIPIPHHQRTFKLENGREVSVSESVLRNEVHQVNHSDVFSPSGTRSVVVGELVKFLEHSHRPSVRFEWPARFGDDESLCSICSSITLDTSVHNAYNSTTGRLGLSVGIVLAKEVSLGTLRSLKRRSAECSLCRVALSVISKDPSIMTDTKVPSSEECILRPGLGAFRTYVDSIPVTDVFYGNRPGNSVRGHIQFSRYRQVPSDVWKTEAMSAVGNASSQQAAARLCDTLISRQNSSDQQIDFRQIRGWLKKCEDEHGSTCSPDRHKSSLTRDNAMFVVIDLDEMRLVKRRLSSFFDYVTLSYVWGGRNSSVTNNRNFESRLQKRGLVSSFPDLPAAVRDACTVVREVGRRFLWVDALCIKQDDPEDQASQIPLMDRIYSQSVLTVVAMSGEHAQCDLPGVKPGSTPNPIQRTERTPSWIFAELPPTLDRVLKLSKYETRAWTLQERLLANRRLYLTRWQAYFQCYRYVYQETYHRPRQIVQDERLFQFQGPGEFYFNLSHARLSLSTQWHIPSLKVDDGSSLIPWDQRSLIMYDKLVNELSARNLWDPNDILKAFQGLVSNMEASQAGPFVAGLPLRVLDRALLWAPVRGLEKRELSKDARPIPSWSWCAWAGPGVKHPWASYGLLNHLLDCDFRAHASYIQDFFLEDSGVFRRVDRNAYNATDKSQPLAVGHPEDYGMSLVQPHGDGGQFLHFVTQVVSADAFNVGFGSKRGQIGSQDVEGDWDLMYSPGGRYFVKAISPANEGVVATCVELGENGNQKGLSSFVYTKKNVPAENEKDPLPATRIFNKGEECGIVLSDEESIRHCFGGPQAAAQRRKYNLVLLSANCKGFDGVRCDPVVREGRGDRFMLYAQFACQGDYSLYNALLTEVVNGYQVRVALVQIKEDAFLEAGTRTEYVRLG
ncbi:heterokaryon incompatibility protein-domain-containing protein [Rhypophila decipiens]|uniref:Heterokaryon incompatibility protein-domain-containing protein n=1 Tax=Rhypophila decipiens TaxID=261697 RepID=A0AAN7B7Q6_9PEZI|nr:heterokaryon incompatibility protein-domain-containing protein [Rhypophila decipiens]